MRAKIIKSLEENKSINLCDLRLDNSFSHMIPKTELRETKQNFSELKTITSKDIIKKMKR